MTGARTLCSTEVPLGKVSGTYFKTNLLSNMTNKKRNTWLYVLLGLAALLVVAVIIKNKNRKTGETVQTELAEKRTIQETVEASGKVFPKIEVKISSDVSGEIVELYVNEGDSVRLGQTLAKVDPEAFASQVERAEAGVNSAKASVANGQAQVETFIAQKKQVEAQLTNAREIHTRNEKLKAEGVISEQDFEASLSNLRSLEANLAAAEANIRSAQQSVRGAEFQVKSAQASLKELTTNLKRATIYATMDGIVSKLNVEKGERVVGTSMMAGTEVLRIADLNVMEVQVEVTENDLPRISVGQKVDIEIDAYLDRKFSGKVVEIAHTASNLTSVTGAVSLTSDQVTNFVVTIDIDPASYKDLISKSKPYPFRPGMSASVEIYTRTKKDVVSVPIQAVGTRDREDLKDRNGKAKKVNNNMGDDDIMEIVFVVQNDTVDMVEVTTGIQNDDYIEIISGLKGGEEVVTGPYSAIARKLEQGDKVDIDNDKSDDEDGDEKDN